MLEIHHQANLSINMLYPYQRTKRTEHRLNSAAEIDIDIIGKKKKNEREKMQQKTKIIKKNFRKNKKKSFISMFSSLFIHDQ